MNIPANDAPMPVFVPAKSNCTDLSQRIPTSIFDIDGDRTRPKARIITTGQDILSLCLNLGGSGCAVCDLGFMKSATTRSGARLRSATLRFSINA